MWRPQFDFWYNWSIKSYGVHPWGAHIDFQAPTGRPPLPNITLIITNVPSRLTIWWQFYLIHKTSPRYSSVSTSGRIIPQRTTMEQRHTSLNWQRGLSHMFTNYSCSFSVSSSNFYFVFSFEVFILIIHVQYFCAIALWGNI